MSSLFLVSTPIGNLKDISLRALEILNQVEFVYAEDTRRTKILFNHYNIKGPINSYQEFNEKRRIPEIIEKLKNGQNVALVSDAGTPLISDPGYKLVRTAIENGFKIESIPGPSAVITALILSGLPTDKFAFLGFFPRKTGQKKTLLNALRQQSEQLSMSYIFFESPYRLVATLQLVYELLGDIDLVVCREMTKLFEEIKRGNVTHLIDYFSKKKIKGEITFLFHL